MKFTLNRNHLSDALALVVNATAKNKLPILQNVKLEVTPECLKITATDLDITISCGLKADCVERGAVTLPARRLCTIVNELPSEVVAFVKGPNDKVRITSGGSVFNIIGLPADQFPLDTKALDGPSFELAQDKLAELLNAVSFAQSSDATRFILNSVLVRLERGGITCAATDGRRLAVHRHKVEGPESGAPSPADGALILPAKAATELANLLGKGPRVVCSRSNDQRHARFAIETGGFEGGLTGPIIIQTKLVEGAYPDYTRVIPHKLSESIKLDRELFHGCIHRASLVTTAKSSCVRLRFDDNALTVSAESSDFGAARESMVVATPGKFKFEASFNPNYLLEPLAVLNRDEVTLQFGGGDAKNTPGVLTTPDGFICVIMPMANT